MISLWLSQSRAPQGNTGNRGTRIHIICQDCRFIFWPACNTKALLLGIHGQTLNHLIILLDPCTCITAVPAKRVGFHQLCPLQLFLSRQQLPFAKAVVFNTRFCYSQGFQVALRSRAAIALCQMGICVLVCVHSWELLCRSQIHLLSRCALTLPSQVTDAILSKRPWDCNN